MSAMLKYLKHKTPYKWSQQLEKTIEDGLEIYIASLGSGGSRLSWQRLSEHSPTQPGPV